MNFILIITGCFWVLRETYTQKENRQTNRQTDDKTTQEDNVPLKLKPKKTAGPGRSSPEGS